MKKIILIILVIGILLAGCGRQEKAQVKLLDSITHKIISGEVRVNGRKLQTQEGIIALKKGKFNISKEGYDTKTIEINNAERIVYLLPTSYLKANITNLNGTGIADVTVQIKNEKAITNQNGTCIISPVAEGEYTIKINKKFFKSKEIPINIQLGENKISTKLSTDDALIQEYLDSLIFPKDQKDFSFSIDISGSLDKQKIQYQFMGKVVNYKLEEVWDKNIHYVFDNGEPFIMNENKEKVKDREKVKALMYARSVIQEILNFKEEINNLNVSDISDSKILLKRNKTFEERSINEEVLLQVNSNKIYKIVIQFTSQDLENANISIQINIQ